MIAVLADSALVLLTFSALWSTPELLHPGSSGGRLPPLLRMTAVLTAGLFVLQAPVLTWAQIALHTLVLLGSAALALLSAPASTVRRLRWFETAVAATMVVAASWTTLHRPGSAFTAAVAETFAPARLVLVAAGGFYCITSIWLIDTVVAALRNPRPALAAAGAPVAAMVFSAGAACAFLAAASSP